MKKINDTVKFLKNKIPFTPEIAIVLGSGLGPLADNTENAISIPYKKIPSFAESTVKGHAGELIAGELLGKKVIFMKGRFHFYEGYSLETVTFPIRTLKALGAKTLFLTNAAGGINASFSAGDLMIITDHINLMGTNPLIGPHKAEEGARFPDMSNVYSKKLISSAEAIAKNMSLNIKKGIYLGTTGPSYETPAEIKMHAALGADAVGMSTVPEAIVANYLGFEIFAVSCITNMAAGILPQPLSHKDVTDTAQRVQKTFISFVSQLIKVV